MPSVPVFKYRFTPNWLMLMLATLVIALFVRLGVWQMQRADEKMNMLQAQSVFATQKATAWNFNTSAPAQYQNIYVQGHYLPNKWLLDNQHYQHQFGYSVLSALELGDDSVVIVDRGWVIGDSTRRSFPKTPIPKEEMRIEGSVYFPSSNPWLLGPEMEIKQNNVIIFEQINTKLWSQLLQKRVHPFIIRLNKQQANGFIREWETVSMPPQRHLAYAWQWFAMALAVLIIFIVLNLKKKL